ncbi:MAG: hypothetical protein ABR607_14995 [Pyrinomonadaceae bacterium]
MLNELVHLPRHIFISYAKQDRAFADQLASRPRHDGFQAWIEGFEYRVSAFHEGAGGKNAQSEYMEVPMGVDQPLRLVLSVQFRN